jgi:hypothetical protein
MRYLPNPFNVTMSYEMQIAGNYTRSRLAVEFFNCIAKPIVAFCKSFYISAADQYTRDHTPCDPLDP